MAVSYTHLGKVEDGVLNVQVDENLIEKIDVYKRQGEMKEKNKLKIAVATHKKFQMPTQAGYFVSCHSNFQFILFFHF